MIPTIFQKAFSDAIPFGASGLALKALGYNTSSISFITFSGFHFVSTITFCALKKKHCIILGNLKENAWLIKTRCPPIAALLLGASAIAGLFSLTLQISLAALGSVLERLTYDEQLKLCRIKKRSSLPFFAAE